MLIHRDCMLHIYNSKKKKNYLNTYRKISISRTLYLFFELWLWNSLYWFCIHIQISKEDPEKTVTVLWSITTVFNIFKYVQISIYCIWIIYPVHFPNSHMIRVVIFRIEQDKHNHNMEKCVCAWVVFVVNSCQCCNKRSVFP